MNMHDERYVLSIAASHKAVRLRDHQTGEIHEWTGTRALYDALGMLAEWRERDTNTDEELIPANVVKLHDRGETCWRRSVDDPAVWATAARSRVATGRVLLDLYGPLKWRDAYGNEDFIVKLTDEKGTNG